MPRTNAELALPQFAELAKYVRDVPSAIALGKALFWDMQAGSDGIVACATCHYRAGADPITVRARNQLNPGPGNTFDVLSGPSNTLASANFPFFQIIPVDGRVGIDTAPPSTAPTATITLNLNDIVGSQGILKNDFVSIVSGTAIESGTPVLDPIYNVGGGVGGNVRQVTGRNAPSAINAVFNFANFWDGRANNIFNGVSPFGPLDTSAQIWINDPITGLTPTKIAIPNASLASQAVGPPMSDVEMSYKGRTFPELGRKLLNNNLIPLGQQLVDPKDSVLGPFSNSPARGLNNNNFYSQTIQAAFQNNLWNSGQTVTINTRGVATPFSQMEANFSLFWGLSIMLYEATLVSDRTPFDSFILGNQNLMSATAQLGQKTFNSKCAVCHSGAELTDAVVGTDTIPNCTAPLCNPVSFITNTNHTLIPVGLTNILGGTNPNIIGGISDEGFFNIAVRPSAEDVGRGGTAPFINSLTGLAFPLSFSALAQLQSEGSLTIPTPDLPAVSTAATPTGVRGSFKTAGLRNVELTPPYFHDGSVFSLDQVVEFYTRGGNFPINVGNPTGNPELAIAIQPIGNLRGNPAGRSEVVAFLKSLTDERVRLEQAPFDHPELRIPSGDPADTLITIPATGGGPAPAAPTLFSLDTIDTTTTAISQTIGGSVDPTATVAVTVNGIESAATVVLSTWNFTVPGLHVGINTISTAATSSTDVTRTLLPVDITVLPVATVTGVATRTGANLTVSGFGVGTYRYQLDNNTFSGFIPVATPLVLSGLQDGVHTVSVLGADVTNTFSQPPNAPTVVRFLVKATPPVLTVNPMGTQVTSTITVSGTVDLGIIPLVSVNAPAVVGQVSVVPGTATNAWSCQVSGLKSGTVTVTVLAVDAASNQTQKSISVNIILPDGSFKGTGTPDISDAVRALRFAVGIEIPSAEELLHGDVAPLVNGVPAPDGKIDIDDALLILKKVVGLVNF